ncbi:MAG TPA: type II toxin-antitoxin system VapC family toxin [Thermoanaerobaculia bacterium]|nr:type II toxin-antitoxin system VapC family toxin [Thermoanaerobaculia bacterium]
MRLALDTNRYTDLCHGIAEVVTLVESAETVFLPFIVLAEVRCGFSLGTRSAENEFVLRRFLMKPGTSVLFADERTIHHYIAVFRQLRRQGTPIPANDLWIAALVLQHDLVLYSRDRHFDHLPQMVMA